MEIVQLDSVNAQPVEELRGLKDLFSAFRGKAQDQMRAEAEPSCLAALDRIDKFSQAVAPIDPPKRFIAHRFQSEFQPDVAVASDIRDEIQNIIRHAVRAGRDGKTDDAGK